MSLDVDRAIRRQVSRTLGHASGEMASLSSLTLGLYSEKLYCFRNLMGLYRYNRNSWLPDILNENFEFNLIFFRCQLSKF